MGWRTVIIDSQCKITYKCGFIVIKKEIPVTVHVSEIDLMVLATPQICFSGVAIAELLKAKVKLIFCDERRDPLAEAVAYYDNYHTSKNVLQQINWQPETKNRVATAIIKQKIVNQANLLNKYNLEEGKMLIEYSNNVLYKDETNREGHAAKVYFNALFGLDFERRKNTIINAALNYGYSILLSYINREIVATGYITQIGINHCNEYNQFNLSCDLIEPFRILIDNIVYSDPPQELNQAYKTKLINVLSSYVRYDSETTLLSNAISKYVKNVLYVLTSNNTDNLLLYEF